MKASLAIGLGVGAVVGIGAAALLLRRTGGLTGSLDARVGALEGRVDDLETKLAGGLRLLGSFGGRLEVLESRGPQVQYIVQQPARQAAPPAPPRQTAPVGPPIVAQPSTMAALAGEAIDPAVRRFQLIEYD